jgi:hypothetical protein
MDLKRMAKLCLGIIAVFLGLLWFLQGAGILRLCPILCFMDCECVMGGSVFWEAAGVIVFIIGVASIYKDIKRIHTR